jgi:hypothetical protein
VNIFSNSKIAGSHLVHGLVNTLGEAIIHNHSKTDLVRFVKLKVCQTSFEKLAAFRLSELEKLYDKSQCSLTWATVGIKYYSVIYPGHEYFDCQSNYCNCAFRSSRLTVRL